MTAAVARIRCVVSGRVQGVAFRAHAADEALRLGVGGWVRNLPDGGVEAVAEGPRAAVDAFVAWCHRGPRLARVDAVAVHPEPPRGDVTRFEIRP